MDARSLVVVQESIWRAIETRPELVAVALDRLARATPVDPGVVVDSPALLRSWGDDLDETALSCEGLPELRIRSVNNAPGAIRSVALGLDDRGGSPRGHFSEGSRLA